jgi:23S rRNA (cytosine1962-C5)-methyltransferase
MPLLRPQPGPPLSLTLSRDLVRTLKRGNPWVFADALRESPGELRAVPPGSHALLHDTRGKPLALGMYDPGPTLCFRACTVVGEGAAGGGGKDPAPRPLDDAWALARLEPALALRRIWLGEDTTGWRLVNGEGDGLPGLVLDVYADTAVIRLDGDGPAGFYDARGIARWAADALGLRAVVERTRGEEGASALVGAAPAEPVPFLENGAWFTADLARGQKTGFFLDQRENRALVRRLAAGRRALNLFGYTGGFSVAAGLGGAAHVTTVDLAAPAVQAAGEHWSMNGLPHAAHEGVVADAFDYLDRSARAGRAWDLVIADPPSFAPNKAALPKALAAYRRLVAAAAGVTAPGALLAAASCSSHVDAPTFLTLCEEGIGTARRRATVVAVHGQPMDHPTPLALPEFRYLKFVLLRVE